MLSEGMSVSVGASCASRVWVPLRDPCLVGMSIGHSGSVAYCLVGLLFRPPSRLDEVPQERNLSTSNSVTKLLNDFMFIVMGTVQLHI